jgi:predicted enzyme related to lactoylglutathione lyase
MNMVGWFEIYVDDLEKAKNFYQKVFQVELKPLINPGTEATPGLEMWSFSQNFESYGASGAICKMEGVNPGGMGTLVYFACEDCSIEESRIAKEGGKVIKSKLSLGEYGFMSMCQDPAGNMIGLHSMK